MTDKSEMDTVSMTRYLICRSKRIGRSLIVYFVIFYLLCFSYISFLHITNRQNYLKILDITKWPIFNRSIHMNCDSKFHIDSECSKLTPNERVKRNITILMWSDFYGHRRIYDDIHKGTSIPDWCTITTDLNQLNESDAIVFHGVGSDWSDTNLPTNHRRPGVPWIMFMLESPVNILNDARQFDGLFNRTMTYRLDSDYPAPYGYFLRRQKPLTFDKVIKKVPKKKKLAVWLVSHCDTIIERERLVAALRKYITIDVYGACGNYSCSFGKNAEADCYKTLGQQYMFYLSFENCICKDYITEKFSNALHHYMVPVVYGSDDYSKILPHNKSYINAKHYSSAKQLSDYLLYLAKNRKAYLEYFEWRRFYESKIRQGFDGFRKLCHGLQQGREATRTKVYKDFYHWWTVMGNCTPGLHVRWSDMLPLTEGSDTSKEPDIS